MPTPYDYDPETLAQLQQLLSGMGEGFRKSYEDRPQEPFLTVEDLAGALSGIPMEPVPIPDITGTVERAGQAVSKVLPATTGYRTPGTVEPVPSHTPSFPVRPGLAGVMEQEPSEWKRIPGDPTGTFRDPGVGTRHKGGPFYVSEGAPSGTWSDYNRAKYGADYTNERTIGTSEYEAGGAPALARMKLFKRLSDMDPTEARVRMYQQTGIDKPFWSQNELLKQIVELPSLESDARMAETQKILGAITEKEQQRRENAWILQQYLGGAGAPPGGGASKETLKTGTTLAREGRAQRQLELSEDRLAGMERREARARPSEDAINARAADILARAKGYAVKRIEGVYLVYKNATSRIPISDSGKVWADARQRAETALLSGTR